MAFTAHLSPRTAGSAHVIVVGNEKGGSGKSTTAMHVAVGLLRMGFAVATIDLDARQASLTRYFVNRQKRAADKGLDLPQPTHHSVTLSKLDNRKEMEADEAERFNSVMAELSPTHDFIVIDAPGTDNYLSRYGHSFADTLITPINDSFVDFVLLASVDPDDNSIVRPSIYAEMVWQQRQQRQLRDRGTVDWIVIRNRMSHLDARNKRDVGDALDHLAKRIGFRVASGFAERVIYRELYLKGLTVLDLMDDKGEQTMTMSHIAARQEVRALLEHLNLPQIRARLHPDTQTEQAA